MLTTEQPIIETQVHHNQTRARRHRFLAGRPARRGRGGRVDAARTRAAADHPRHPPKRWLGGLWGLDSSTDDTIDRHAANALKEVAQAADPQRKIELSTGVLPGAAARSIVDAARDYQADLIVVGARGERDAAGERVLGGTSAKLLATAQVPLLLVRRDEKDPVMGVVAALDLSARSRVALEWADLAAAERHLYAYHVYDVPFATRLECLWSRRERHRRV